jgi:molybdenum cofactor biosynthesis protein B
MSAEQHRTYSPGSLGFAFLTVSDTRTAADDTGGSLLRELALAAGHRVAAAARVPDDAGEIRRALKDLLASPQVDVAVTTGGTGFSPRDVTVEALAPLFSRPIEGFGELFRMLSFAEVGPAAMLSRAAAGVIGRQAVFLLPGSPKAVRLAMERLILPEAGHLLGQMRRPASP